MKNTNSTYINNKPHSAEYFGDERDYWWNQDYIDLVSNRLELKKYKNILDLGCGVGHWGQVLAPFLCDDVKVTGLDREEKWIDIANKKAKEKGHSNAFSYQQGDVMKLPFENESFDFVTCQTLLIHLEHPIEAILEMKRVLRPGGLILVSEPNNTANRAVSDSILDKLSIDERAIRIKNDLRVQKGKEALGEGFNSLGDLVPGLMNIAGLNNINVTIGDKANPFIPPYESKAERAYIKTMRDWVARDFIGWHRDDLHRYFLAGGGSEAEYHSYVEMSIKDGKDRLKAIDEGIYHSAGGSLGYLISGYKEKASTIK